MKRYTLYILITTYSLLTTHYLPLSAQNPDGDYNPYVSSAAIVPSPLLPLEVNGAGVLSFTLGNNATDPLEVFGEQRITLTITLSFGVPDNADPRLAVGGSAAGLFNWTYSAGTYTAEQTGTIAAGYSGNITINYRVTQNSTAPGSNGFNVNITPAAYQTASNVQTDDAVSFYTYTEIRDYSDAPASYGIADHAIDFSTFLGALVDGEPAALPSANANGDDTDGADDEDGVVFPANITQGQIINLPVTVTGLGYLNAWIDWNGDGDFADAGERVVSNTGLSDETRNISITVPSDAITGSPTFARFRFSFQSISSPTGSASTGEVEDYQLTILCAPPTPELSSSETDNTFCEGTPVSFTAGGGNYYEFRIDGVSAQSGASNIFTVDSLANGEAVDVIVTDDIGCSATSGALENTVYPLPTAGLESDDSDNTFCAGTIVTFTATGGTNFDFRINGVRAQNSGSAIFSTDALLDGQIVDVIVTDGNSCADTSLAITNTVLVNPTVDAGTILPAICENGTTLALGGNVGGSATGGYWTSSAGGIFTPDSTNLNATWTPPAGYSGTATLTLTSTGGNCGPATDAKTQEVNLNPQVVVTDPAAVCSPLTVDLTNAAVTAGSTVGLTFSYWTDAAATIELSTPTAVTTGTYYIMGTSGSTGCYDTQPVNAIVNPTPATPEVIVADNCDGTSTLSTTASGSLLWSTGETTSMINVNLAGAYTVTTTVNGCISDEGSGTAAPRTSPLAPTVSNAVPVNECPETTIDLSSLITSTAPVGGLILYKTADDPGSSDVSNPVAVGSGTYYLFYQSQDGCYSTGTEVAVTINSCPPDLTPTLIINPNIMHGITDFELVVRVTELNLLSSSGTITVHIPKEPRISLPDGFLPTLTTVGGNPVDNSSWAFSEDTQNYIFTSNAVIPAGGFSSFGLRVRFDPGSSRGFYSITVQLVSGSGGEIRVNNNVDSERLDYFQE